MEYHYQLHVSERLMEYAKVVFHPPLLVNVYINDPSIRLSQTVARRKVVTVRGTLI